MNISKGSLDDIFMHYVCLQATPGNIVVGNHVWVEDPVLAWIDGEVFKINGREIHVRMTNGKAVCFAITIVVFCILSRICSWLSWGLFGCQSWLFIPHYL